MHFGNFEVTTNGNNYTLKRNAYPKVIFELELQSVLIVKNIICIDKCKAAEIVFILSEVDDFIKSITDKDNS